MYRLLFADDEHIVREGITTRVPWGENGFELARVCANGREVLEALQDDHVDVVLSDISMPLMDGLSVSREISRDHPEVLLLLLTGYDQFEYAQEALKYRVWELLLKPITADELQGVLERVRSELDRRRSEREEQDQLRAKLEESLPLLRARFLYRLVLGQLGAAEIRRRAADLQWQDRDGWYQAGIVHVPSEWDELQRLAITELATEITRDAGDLFVNREENLVLLLQGESREKLQQRATEIATEILRRSSRSAAAPVPVALGEPVPSTEKLSRSYRGARGAMDYIRLLGLPQVVTAGDISRRDALSVESFHERAKRLVDLLREHRGDEALAAVDSIFAELEHHYTEPGAAEAYLARIQFLLLDFMEEMQDRVDDELPENAEALLYAQRYGSLTEARIHFHGIVTQIVHYLEQRKHRAVASRMQRARQVIEERYAEPGFSLQDVCDEVFLSVSQFSVLFKEDTGRTFVEYLTGCRIERAQELLRTTDLRTYEVADRVGYADPRYFTYVFKKVTGMTSSEYRGRGA